MAFNEEAVRKLVEEKSAEIEKGADYYTLLGIAPDADTVKVKRAYFGLVKMVHPDMVNKIGDDELFEKAQNVFQVLTQAFQTLSDSTERAKYGKGTNKTPYEKKKTVVDKKEDARVFFHKGKMLLERRAYIQARKALEQAVKLDPKVGDYHLYLGFTWYYDPDITDEVRLPKTRKHFEKALELDTENPKASYAMSLYYRAMGEFTMEYNALQDALTLDPNYVEAQRAMRLLSLRWKKNKSSLSGQWADLVSSIKKIFSKPDKKKK